MAKTQAHQAIRDLNRRVARGEVPADAAAARLAAIHETQAVAVYRAALDMAARRG